MQTRQAEPARELTSVAVHQNALDNFSMHAGRIAARLEASPEMAYLARTLQLQCMSETRIRQDILHGHSYTRRADPALHMLGWSDRNVCHAARSALPVPLATLLSRLCTHAI